ncbi:hypothetical protein FH972_022195 [Carpinus fangiana]|uniref:Cellobiose dehydrogenase-like cytochrome domain-containing protein n=1 Tax=Carpinus fangiana TaxID=176857 RepID=A0A5N6KRJ1_9ROSI|nr:hypothetical protein FH972_022195 [Carpinus fangiana]
MIKVVALLLWLSCHVMGRTAQFCTGEEGVNSCFAVDTAGLDDDTVRIVASIHFPSATGWAALGAGTRMSDAVMFVVALNADKSDVLVSARTTPSGHAAPQEAPALMDKLETHPSARGPNDTYIVDFTCHACDIQEPAAWLWATNPSQPLASSDFNAALEMHATFGRFALNPATTLDADPDPTFPSRESFGITPLSAHPASSSYALFIAHGTDRCGGRAGRAGVAAPSGVRALGEADGGEWGACVAGAGRGDGGHGECGVWGEFQALDAWE